MRPLSQKVKVNGQGKIERLMIGYKIALPGRSRGRLNLRVMAEEICNDEDVVQTDECNLTANTRER